MNELVDLSDDGLLELVDRILKADEEATTEAIDSLAVVTKVAYNVAERLLTGRRAEEFFLANSQSIIEVQRELILDMRNSARGFDFGIIERPELAVEVKGMKTIRGDIQFTDREWSEASARRSDFWLVVVGNLSKSPIARVIKDPHSNLAAECKYSTVLSASWRSTVTVLP